MDEKPEANVETRDPGEGPTARPPDPWQDPALRLLRWAWLVSVPVYVLLLFWAPPWRILLLGLVAPSMVLSAAAIARAVAALVAPADVPLARGAAVVAIVLGLAPLAYWSWVATAGLFH